MLLSVVFLSIASAARIEVQFSEESLAAAQDLDTGVDDEDLLRLGKTSEELLAGHRLDGGLASLAQVHEADSALHKKPLGAKAKQVHGKTPRSIRTRMHRVWTKKGSLEIIERQLKEVRSDMVMSGYTTAYEAFKSHSRDTMELLLDLALRGLLMKPRPFSEAAPMKPCSQVPLSMLSHPWRYRHQDLRRCLSGLREGEACFVRCALFSEAGASLTCGQSPVLEGRAHENHCRQVPDASIVDTDNGAVRGILRPIVWSQSLSKEHKGKHDLGWHAPRSPGLDKLEEFKLGSEQDLMYKKGNFTLGYVRTFWQIPFGRPPMRFSRPVKATSWRPKVLQLPDYWADDSAKHPRCEDGVERRQDGKEIGEPATDCLSLHVYAPTGPKRKRPVLYWIPGTGFTNSDVWSGGIWDMGRLAFWNDFLVVVSNFRCGLVGHWASAAAQNEDPDGSTGNYGLMDQRLAMQWIQANIAKFGGDPHRVTVGGVSSGGISANFHLFSPASRGLFHALGPEGSSFDSPALFQNLQDATTFYRFVAEHMGCPAGPAAQLQCLRELPHSNFSAWILDQRLTLQEGLMKKLGPGTVMGKIAGAAWSALGNRGRVSAQALPEGNLKFRAAPLWPNIAVGPVVDGSVAGLPKQPFELVGKPGGAAPVPVYASLARDEGTAFAGMLIASFPWYKFPTLTHAAIEMIWKWVFNGNEELFQKAMELYPMRSDDGRAEAPLFRFGALISDAFFRCPARRLARRGVSEECKRNWLKDSGDWPTVFLSEVYYAMEMPFVGDVLGASHLQSGFLFNSPYLKNTTSFNDWDSVKEKMRLKINCHYAAFVYCGSPSVDPVSRGCASPTASAEDRSRPLRQCSDPLLKDKDFPVFNAFDATDAKLYVHDLDTKVVSYPEDADYRCQFWDTVDPSMMRFPEHQCFACNISAEEKAKVWAERRKIDENREVKRQKRVAAQR